MRIRRTYISGPMTGLPEYNFPAFYEAENRIRSKYPTTEIVNPAKHFGRKTDLPWHIYIGWDIGKLLDCTHMEVLGGWAKSKGVTYEILTALAMGISVDFSEKFTEEEADKYVDLHEIHDEAYELVYGDRGRDYGHPYDDYLRTVQIQTAISMGSDVFFETLSKEVLENFEEGFAETAVRITAKKTDPAAVKMALQFMMAVKISRQINRNKHDNLLDFCGYVICYKRCLERIKETL